MKEKWKTLSISMIIAVILVSIILSFMYIAYDNKIKEFNEFQEKVEDLNSSGLNIENTKKEYNQNVVFLGMIYSISVFCIVTLISYMILERVRKRKK